MTTQTHKWLPSEPTQEMLDAERFASSLAYESHEVQAVEVYQAMWQAAPEVEQEPVAWKDLTYGNLHHQDFGNSIPLYTRPQPKRMSFSGGDVRKIYESVKAETGLNLSLGAFFVAFDAAEKHTG
jgi:hypothetical protein